MLWNKVNNGKKFIIPILSDAKKHWTENRISFIYFYNLETFEESILGIGHNDVSKYEIQTLNDFIGKDNYILNSKYLIGCEANYEANLVVWFETNKKLEVQENKTIRSYQNQFQTKENINDCIPIMKWLEYCRDIKDSFLISYKNFELTESFLKYNQLINDLSQIEKNGLFTD